jgi:hypothetical protein
MSTESFAYSRQKFQGILIHLELLYEEMKNGLVINPDIIEKHLESIIASSDEFARFLRDSERASNKTQSMVTE